MNGFMSTIYLIKYIPDDVIIFIFYCFSSTKLVSFDYELLATMGLCPKKGSSTIHLTTFVDNV